MLLLTISKYLGSKILSGNLEPGNRMVLSGKIGTPCSSILLP